MKHTVKTIKAVLFDFDGTLTRPGALDFDFIKQQVGCPTDQPVLEFIHAMPDRAARDAAAAALERFECEGAARSEPNDGAEALVAWLRARRVRIGILSRNSRASVERALANFDTTRLAHFDLVLSRDDGVAPKPSPDGVLAACRRFGIAADELLVVGDFVFDVQAGARAGSLTALLDNGRRTLPFEVTADFRISRLKELEKLVGLRLPLTGGKLPNEYLEDFLRLYRDEDPSLLIRPGVGEDTAAVSVKDEDVVILKSDPITFVTDAIGYYSVLINANDIATSGGRPRWFLTTLLFPPGTTPLAIQEVMRELGAVCRRFDISLCGGHTEITDAVTRPVVTGLLVGTVERDHLISKRGMRPGDRILLTKKVAVEGTAIIAREFETRLAATGMPSSDIEQCKQFLDRISILEEARIAARHPGVSAMHDVTEGGLATAVTELGIAGGGRLHIDLDRIPIFPQTAEICRRLGIDPLGLIGSGSLLICCRPQNCDQLMAAITAAGIDVTLIGAVAAAGRGIDAVRDGRPAAWPHFETDELTRLF